MMRNERSGRPTADEFTITQMDQSMKATGKTTTKMGLVVNIGLMDLHIKEAIKMGESMDLEYLFGQMVQNMKESFKKMTCMGKGSISGKTKGSTKGSGTEM